MTDKILRGAIAVLCGALLAACSGGGGDDGEQITSDASHLLSDDAVLQHAAQYKGQTLRVMVPEPLNDWFKGGAAEFEKATSTTVRFDVVPFDQIVGKYSTLAAGRDASSDVFYTWSAITAQMGPLLFEDLTDQLGDLAMKYTDGSLSAVRSGGHTYGLPYMTSIQIMYYNKALFRAAGLDVDSPPKDWASFVAAAKAITGGGNYGFVTGGQTANDVFAGLWLPALNGAGGRMYSDDLKKATVDTPEGLAAMKALADLGSSGAVSPSTWSNSGSQDAAISFATGKVGMTFNFPLAYPIVADPKQSKMSVGDLGAAVVPGVKLRSGSVDGSEGFTVNRYSEKKELALDFITYLTGPTVQRTLALGDLKTVPSRTSLLSDNAVVSAIPVAPTVAEQAKSPADRAGSAFYGEVSEAVNAEVRQVMQQGADPAQKLTEMQKKIQQIVDQYWANNK